MVTLLAHRLMEQSGPVTVRSSGVSPGVQEVVERKRFLRVGCGKRGGKIPRALTKRLTGAVCYTA